MKVSDFKNTMWDYTRKIAESMNNAFSPVCEEHHLTMMQARILMELYHNKSHTVGSLANSLSVAGANISTMCKKLESKGYLERVRDQEDERVVKLALTNRGKKTVLAIDKSLNEKISQQVVGEAKKDFDDIILGLKKLNSLLQKISIVEKE
ncbi:MarR family transcriptional regulator [Peptococcaceae bacterium 1198_IL3148]